MLRVQQRFFDVLDDVASPQHPAGRTELGEILQNTLQLEHATIPPYLIAAYSLRGATNRPIRDLILRIAKEEMLHMAVIANLMNAIGVRPRLNDPAFIPKYPDALPMLDVGDWKIELRGFARDRAKSESLVRDTFMRIESPEFPGGFPDDPQLAAASALMVEPPRTIGALYERIIALIKAEAVPGLFDGAPERIFQQVTKDLLRMIFRPVQVEKTGPARNYPLPADIDFKIVDVATAVRHLRWIVGQGEGTTQRPMDAEGMPAHYYRFESIVYEEYLVQDPTFPGDAHYDGGFAFSGADLTLDLNNVHEFDTNPDPAQYSNTLREAMAGFRQVYRDMLAFLDQAFNCPDGNDGSLAAKAQAYRDSVSCMRQLPARVDEIIQVAGDEQKGGTLPF